jgi:hypothetical protein
MAWLALCGLELAAGAAAAMGALDVAALARSWALLECRLDDLACLIMPP